MKSLESTTPSMILVYVFMFMMFVRNVVRDSIPNPKVGSKEKNRTREATEV